MRTASEPVTTEGHDFRHVVQEAFWQGRPLPESFVAELVARHYFAVDVVTVLGSEADATFRVDRGDESFVLKLSERAGAAADFGFQARMLNHLSDTRSRVPKVVPARNGADTFAEHDGSGTLVGYVQTVLPGRLCNELRMGADWARDFGRVLGQLTADIAPFRHPDEQRPLLWNIRNWAHLPRMVLDLAADDQGRRCVEWLSEFREYDMPRLRRLPWQNTHNDPSPFNMIEGIDGRLGFIDFGDAGWTPRVLEVATAMTHHVGSAKLDAAAALLSGYREVIALSDEEVAMVPTLMRARSAFVVLINAWRSRLFPEKAAYFNKSTARCMSCLEHLEATHAR